jgi:hypothetical protein
MAVFNPDVPDQPMPNYTGYSKGISPVEGNKTWGLIAKGVGDVLENTVQAYDLQNKAEIDKKVDAGINEIRDAEIQRLSAAADVVTGKTGAGPAPTALNPTTNPADAQTPPLNLLDPNKSENIPPEVAQAGEYAANARMAGLNSTRDVSKELKLYYDAKMLMFAKSIRSQYPGYVDYIDQKVSNELGGNPANLVLASQRALLAAQAGQREKEFEYARKLIMEHYNENSAATLALLYAGKKNVLDVVNMINEDLLMEARNKKLRDAVSTSEAARKEGESVAQIALSDAANNIAARTARTLASAWGLKDSSDLSRLLFEYKTQAPGSEGAKLSSEEITKRGYQMQAYLNPMRQELYKYLREVRKDSNGNDYTLLQRINPANEEAFINNALAPWKSLAEDYLNKNTGAAALKHELIDAAKNDTFYRYYTEKGAIGAQFRAMDAFHRGMGQNFLEWWVPQFFKQNTDLMAKSKTGVAGLLNWELARYSLGTSDPNLPPERWDTPTINQTIEDFKKNDEPPEMYKAILRFPELIYDPRFNEANPEAAKNLAMAAFHPSGRFILDKFPLDRTDPRTKLPILGANTVFDRWFDKKMSDTLWRLYGGKGAGWNNYKDAGETMFHSLLRRDIENLNQINMFSVNKGTGPVLMYEIGFDPDKSELKLYRTRGDDPWYKDHIPQERLANASLERVNRGLDKLKHLYEIDGTPLNERLVLMLANAGLKYGQITNLPDQIYNAVVRARNLKDPFRTTITGKDESKPSTSNLKGIGEK